MAWAHLSSGQSLFSSVHVRCSSHASQVNAPSLSPVPRKHCHASFLKLKPFRRASFGPKHQFHSQSPHKQQSSKGNLLYDLLHRYGVPFCSGVGLSSQLPLLASGEKGDSSHIQESNVKAKISSSLFNLVFTSCLLHGASAMSAFAVGDETLTKSDAISESLEAASSATTWLIPTILAFPVVTYLLFNVYRDKVNPYAKISDWLFGLAVVVIVGNIVMMATLGVRLY